MTKISSRKIRKLLSPWKKLRHIWLWDGQYYIFDMPTLKEVVEKCSVQDIEPKGELFQCEARARWLQTLVGMYQYDLPDMRHKWAFGYCAGRKFNGKAYKTWFGQSEKHAVNIAITDQGIALIEPANNHIRLADNKNDDIFYVGF